MIHDSERREWREKAIDKPQVTMSAYDLLPEEDLRALRWVREYGGIEKVRRDFRDSYNRRTELCAVLGIDLATGWSDAMAEMGRRLMPEDMEWPRYESGELVLIGDDVTGQDYGESIHVDEITFHANGFTLRSKTGLDHWYENDDRFKRPAVPQAMGSRCAMGETVWNVKTGERYVVGAFASGCVNVSDGRGGGLQLLPSQLTHERPESWERWIEDAGKSTCEYFGSFGTSCDGCQHDPCQCDNDRSEDLVRRAKALAERGRL